MWKWWLEFAARQSQVEVQRQFSVINQMAPRRRLLSLLPYAVATIYLPVWLCLALMVLDAGLERAGINLLADLDPPRQPRRYLVALAAFAAAQFCYLLVPALIWQIPVPYARAFAVAMFMINLLHLSTVRSVHFPLAIIALSSATLISLITNALHWIIGENWTGLAVSTLCILATAYFVRMTMTAIHQLHQQVFRDQQAAEVANDTQSRFLAQMSHELRTPLNAILGMGYAELTKATSAESRDRLSTMVQSARGLSVLLSDILDLSAMQAGQLPIRPSAVDLRAETQATLALFGQQISDAGLSLAVVIDDLLPALARIDGQRFRQCLSNVLSNAIKYTESGGIKIDLTLPRPGQVAIEVLDSGHGIPEALRERIFEPFHRGDSLVSGTGLGLSISRTLARRMGGDLVLLPSAKGARFRLSFALLAAGPDDAVTPEPQATFSDNSPQALALADLSGRRVLVVDDIATNRLVAATYLRIMGATPQEADSGERALALMLSEVLPDVVLLDMLMPQIDGLTTFARIRALPGAAGRVPVIAMTADASEQHRRHYLSAGLSGYVSKPLSPETLGAAIVAVLPI